MATKEHWDEMYDLPLDKIPWEIEKPPHDLVDVLKKKLVKNGSVLDLGCGTGNYSIYLSKKGFDVTGVDFSKNALRVAKMRAQKARCKIKFVFGDVLNLSQILKNRKFDFIFDYSLLHHVPRSKTASYEKQFRGLLKQKGKLLLICYSEKDEDAKKRAQTRGRYGNIMYYRTAGEIRKVYNDLKEISYHETNLGKRLHHRGHCFLFENQ